jgi:thiamine biosynthesis lipoprotein
MRLACIIAPGQLSGRRTVNNYNTNQLEAIVIKQIKFWPLAVIVASLILVGCSQPQQQSTTEEKRLQGQAIGTTYSIIFLEGGESLSTEQLEKEFNGLIDAANKSMSTYHKSSEISVFNRMKSTKPVKASETLRQVVAEGIRLHELTSGSLDITLKPLSGLWGFGPNHVPHKIPSDEALAAIRAKTGVDKLVIEGEQLSKKIVDLEVDLNTIGKGFLVDQTAQLLESHKINHYLVEIGGEMRIKGYNGRGKPWKIGVINPISGTPKAQRAVYPGNHGVATSGDYYQYFEENGVRYSHILAPATGRPISHNLASVTVFHPSAMTADGLATAIMVMGAEKGLALAKKHNFAIYLIIRDGDKFISKMSSAFEPHLSEEKITKTLL